mgnify:CR=1 FL=1
MQPSKSVTNSVYYKVGKNEQYYFCKRKTTNLQKIRAGFNTKAPRYSLAHNTAAILPIAAARKVYPFAEPTIFKILCP